MSNPKSQKEIEAILEENSKIARAAISASEEAKVFSEANGITFQDIKAEIEKLPKVLQDQIIREANDISKTIVADYDPHGQEQKRKINRKMTRYKNRI